MVLFLDQQQKASNDQSAPAYYKDGNNNFVAIQTEFLTITNYKGELKIQYISSHITKRILDPNFRLVNIFNDPEIKDNVPLKLALCTFIVKKIFPNEYLTPLESYKRVQNEILIEKTNTQIYENALNAFQEATKDYLLSLNDFVRNFSKFANRENSREKADDTALPLKKYDENNQEKNTEKKNNNTEEED